MEKDKVDSESTQKPKDVERNRVQSLAHMIIGRHGKNITSLCKNNSHRACIRELELYSDFFKEICREATRKCVREFDAKTGYINCFAFNSAGSFLSGANSWSAKGGFHLTGGSYNDGHPKAMRVWDINSGELLKEFSENGSDAMVYNDDHKHLASICYFPSKVTFWDITSNQNFVTELEQKPIGLGYIKSNDKFVVVLENGIIQKVDGTYGNITYLKLKLDKICKASFSKDGTYLAVVKNYNEHEDIICIYDINKNEGICEVLTNKVHSLAFSPDDNYLAIAGCNTIRIFDIEKKERYMIFEIDPHGEYWGGIDIITYSPDGKYIASTSGINIKIWSVALGMCVSMLRGHKYRVSALEYSPNGKFIFSGDVHSKIKVWFSEELDDTSFSFKKLGNSILNKLFSKLNI